MEMCHRCCHVFLCGGGGCWGCCALRARLSQRHPAPGLPAVPGKGVLGRGTPPYGGVKELRKLPGDLGSWGCRGKQDKPAGSTFGLEIRRGLSSAAQGHVMSLLAIAILAGNQSCWGLTGERWCSHILATRLGAQWGPQALSLSP